MMQVKQIIPSWRSESMLRWIIILAALSFLLALFLPSVGEEGVYTNATLEMLHRHNYLSPTLFGVHYYRPPLFNWLILALTKILTPANIVIAARLVNITATLITAWALAAFTRYKFKDRELALFASAIYLSGDLLFKRGWLAYADSLFALFVFAAIISLWLALDYKQNRFLVLAAVSLSLGFMAKIHAIYIFYAGAALVLFCMHKNRSFLLRPRSWLIHAASLIVPLLWVKDFSGNLQYSQSLAKWPGLLAYLMHVFISYPVDLLIRFLPASVIAAYFLISKRFNFNYNSKIVLWMIGLNILPYWLVPLNSIRYILPLYPLIALVLAYIVCNVAKQARIICIYALLACLLLRYILAIFWDPYLYNKLRGNAKVVALQILQDTHGSNLYINDTTSQGLRVAVELNILRPNQAPLTSPPVDFDGFLLTDNQHLANKELVKVYSLNKKKIYLYASPFKTSAS